jgi:cGMP-dependent protein kinase 1
MHIIECMHQKSLIYRDLKPENVMLCSDGYLKLIDLGTCKKLNGNEKTFTMIGTPNYMAPETLAGKGYSFPADLWSLGVMLFEFMAGYVPYGEEAEDPLQIYQEILKNILKFPKHMKDSTMNSFISLLLNKNPETRLGGSFTNIKKNPIFAQVEWHQLINKDIKPAFEIPK